MLTLTKQPKLFELSGNPVTVEVLSDTITTSNHKISIRVSYLGAVIGEETLPVINNVSSFDISDYLKQNIEGDFNIFDLFQTTPIAFSHLLHSFTFQVYETYNNDGIEHYTIPSSSFYAIQGGFSKLFYDSYLAQGKNFYDNFITTDKKFLTWAPSKKLTWNQHDILYYLNTLTNKTMFARYVLHYNDDTSQTVDSATFLAQANSLVLICPSYLAQVLDQYDSTEKYITSYEVTIFGNYTNPGTKQVETATIEGQIVGVAQVESIDIEGTITQQGWANFDITSIYLNDGDPWNTQVWVNDTTETNLAILFASVLNGGAPGQFFQFSTAGNHLYAQSREVGVQDNDLNMAYSDNTCIGLEAKTTSTNHTPASGGGTVVTTITSALFSQQVISFAAIAGDNEFVVASKMKDACNIAPISTYFDVSYQVNEFILTAKTAAANDITLNIAFTNGTAEGLIPDATSTNTVAGIAPYTASEINLSETRTYYIDRNIYNFGRQFVFMNSLGTFDIIHLKGLSENVNELQRTIGFFQTLNKTSHSEFSENYKVASGFICNQFDDIGAAQRYITELFNSREIYEIVGQRFVSISPASNKVKINKDAEFLYSFIFDYNYSHTDQFYAPLDTEQYFNPRIFYTNGIIAEVAPGQIATVNFDARINVDTTINFTLDWGADVGTSVMNNRAFSNDITESLSSSIEIPGNVNGDRTLIITDSIGGAYYIPYSVNDNLLLFNDGDTMLFNNWDQMQYN
jgi:hypothetical protein